MRSVTQLALFLGVLVLSASLLASSSPSPAEVEYNRRLVAKWRQDPVHYARLKEELRAFRALTPTRQAALREMDNELQDNAALRGQLLHVIDRYETWRKQLSQDDRDSIDQAPTSAKRVEIIRGLLEQEWINRLPRARAELVKKASGEQRAALIDELRRQERERRLEWQRAIVAQEELPAWRVRPTHLVDLPREINNYVTYWLFPLLSPEEKRRLHDAEGQWPQFGQRLLDLVDKHQAILPGPVGPTHAKNLPDEVLERLQQLRGPERRRIEALKGLGPDYAMAVAEHLRAHHNLPRELGPCSPDAPGFSPGLRQFIANDLVQKLTEKEKEQLSRAQGRWPDYPREVLVLARQHNLRVPGLILPGPRNYWERLRAAVVQQ
jgi:hypothetical protein